MGRKMRIFSNCINSVSWSPIRVPACLLERLNSPLSMLASRFLNTPWFFLENFKKLKKTFIFERFFNSKFSNSIFWSSCISKNTNFLKNLLANFERWLSKLSNEPSGTLICYHLTELIQFEIPLLWGYPGLNSSNMDFSRHR